MTIRHNKTRKQIVAQKALFRIVVGAFLAVSAWILHFLVKLLLLGLVQIIP